MYITMMINLKGFPRCGAPTHLLPMLACLSLLCMCGLGLCHFSGPGPQAGLCSAAAQESSRAQPEGALLVEYLFAYV